MRALGAYGASGGAEVERVLGNLPRTGDIGQITPSDHEAVHIAEKSHRDARLTARYASQSC
jgi:hypothetical protein